jgi:hypothetical protein
MDGGELLKYQNFKGTECEVLKENNLSVVYMKKFEHFLSYILRKKFVAHTSMSLHPNSVYTQRENQQIHLHVLC